MMMNLKVTMSLTQTQNKEMKLCQMMQVMVANLLGILAIECNHDSLYNL